MDPEFLFRNLDSIFKACPVYKRFDASLTESSTFRLSYVWFTLKFTSELKKKKISKH